jgi:RNA polymerase sigma-70 factor (ECF subfamily)
MDREAGVASVPQTPAGDDASLLARLQSGDQRAMATLYDRYSRLVYSVALRILRDSATAEDVLHEILMQLWRNPEGFTAARGNLGTWLAVVTRNRAIDTLRRKRGSAPIDDLPLVGPGNLAEEAERNRLMQRARATIQQLPREQRKMLEMAFFDGLTHFELAEMTGDPLGKVKTRIRTALLSLRKGVPAVSDPRLTPPTATVPTEGGAHHPASEDLVLFAMQLFPPEQVGTIERHAGNCAVCREELGRTYGDLAVVALSAEPAAPSVGARDRLLGQVARENKIVATATAKPAVRPAPKPAPLPVARPLAEFGRKDSTPIPQPVAIASLRLPMHAWAGWAVAAALAIASGFLYHDHRSLQENLTAESSEMERLNARAAQSHQLMDALTDPQAVRVTLAPKAPPHRPVGGLTYNAKKGTLVFLASNLDPIQTYKTYELWVIPAGRSAPIPAGTFHPDEHGSASVIMPNLPKGVDAKAFGVTIEDAGGSDKPTMPFILSGS